jgi:hypothetical protein
MISALPYLELAYAKELAATKNRSGAERFANFFDPCYSSNPDESPAVRS